LAISKERKQELLAWYDEAIENSRALILTEYRGLSNTELSKVRSSVRDANGSYNIVKLTLFKIALEKAGLPVPKEIEGPVAVGFCYQEVPSVAKVFRDFSKDQELLTIKGGIMGNRVLTTENVKSLADLPPLEIVRAQVLGILAGPARNLAGVVAGGVRQVVNVLNAYAEKDSDQASAEA
jgi:large subunit ribosomal protein L10